MAFWLQREIAIAKGREAYMNDDCQNKASGALKRMSRLVRLNRRTLIIAVCAVVFLALFEDVAEGQIMHLDVLAYRFFVEYLRSDALTPVMEEITDIASPTALVVIWLVASALSPGKRPGLCMALNFACSVALNYLLKFIVQRPRPEGFRLICASGYSFPSGHSMIAMAFFGLIIYFVWHYEEDRRQCWIWTICFSIVIALIGISRIYLGVHYASDVVAGFCVSMAWLAVYTKLFCPLLLGERPASSSSDATAAK
jgi:undecaprenyl-diphosphatase